ncbi:MAG: hypothetical protein DHS20C18_50970 [Saprospiraceae bacterium]|nr:MAG: hypothetical protein DHS20C18_50970 [Saprospiraceae bacterium]
MKTFLFTLGFCSLFFLSYAQDTLICNASSLFLNTYQPGTGSQEIVISLSPEDAVIDYSLHHIYEIGDITFEDILIGIEPTFPIALNPEARLHQFFPVNRCTDDSLHIGSTLFLDFSEADPFCPPPTNLQILMLSNNFISFQWDNAPEAVAWNVAYLPGGVPMPGMDTPDPSWEQVLSPTDTLHTFEIYSICPGFATVHSATVRFSIITIDDVKVLLPSCDDLEDMVQDAYYMYCTKHGFFGPNKQDFLSIHHDCTISAVSSIEPLFSGVAIFPNPSRDRYLQLHFNLIQATSLHLSLLDMHGRSVKTFPLPELLYAGRQNLSLDTGDLPPGLYCLKIGDGRSQRYFRVVQL